MDFPSVCVYFLLHVLIRASIAAASQQHVLMNRTVSFASDWSILGPFKIGTREFVWQSDPLEALGGFSNIQYNEADVFPSALKADALVSWKSQIFQTTTTASSTTVDIVISHGEIDWNFIRSIYGWAAVQYQSWTRGILYNNAGEDLTVTIDAPGVVDLVIEGSSGTQHHFGVDFYGFQRAPIVTRLKPGPNVVNARLVRDVRASGGQMPPLIEAFMTIRVTEGDASIVKNSILVPDVYARRFVSALASLTMVNHGTEPLFIESISIGAPEGDSQTTRQQLWIQPGQSRPLQFCVDQVQDPGPDLVATVAYQKGSVSDQLIVPIQARTRPPGEAHKITFQHPSGVVSYAVLLPPSNETTEHHKGPVPVMVALHGSGLDVNSDQVRHSFDGAPDLPAWLLFPSGMSPWCGDDWHTWGMADIDAALEAVPAWLHTNQWRGSGVLIDRFLIAGHSNGGHGTWNYALKRPDRIMAAAPASGYISVENYVPQSMWDGVDPAQTAVLSAARAAFRQELFLENMRGKPVLVQHGELDDNVPAYHSRLMQSYSLLQRGLDLEYAEIPTKFHWWDGAMTTQPMLEFYLKQLTPPIPHAHVPEEFSFVVADAHEFGSIHGLHVVQLYRPDALGRMSVSTSGPKENKTWTVSTRNIRRIRLDHRNLPDDIQTIRFDGEPTSFLISGTSEGSCFTRSAEGWVEGLCNDTPLTEKTGQQRGSMDAILRTQGAFQIVGDLTEGVQGIMLQVSRNFLQYFGADSALLGPDDYTTATRAEGNVVSVWLATSPPESLLKEFPIQIDNGKVHIRMDGRTRADQVIRRASSAVWLQPLEGGKLELVIWGANERALRQAARLVPTVTGGGQPNFVVFADDDVTGVYGKVVAMGFFDFAWNISAASYVP